MFLVQLAKALDKARVPYAIVGGYAVALHGAVRGTVDIDLVLNIEETEFVKAENVFKNMGLEPRLPVDARQVFKFRNEYIQNRNMIAWSFYNPKNPIESVDVVITHDCRDLKIVKIQAFGTILRIASRDDLIRMKTSSGRIQDQVDVDALRKSSRK